MPPHGPGERPPSAIAAHPELGRRLDVGTTVPAPHTVRPDRSARAVLAATLLLGGAVAAAELFAPPALAAAGGSVALAALSVASTGVAASLLLVARATRLQGGPVRRAAAWRLLALGFMAFAAAPAVLRDGLAHEALSWLATGWPASRADLLALAGRPWPSVLGALGMLVVLSATAFVWSRARLSGLRDTVFLSAACLLAGIGLCALPFVPDAVDPAAEALAWSTAAVRGAAAPLARLLLLLGAGTAWCAALRQLAHVGDGLRLRLARGVASTEALAAVAGGTPHGVPAAAAAPGAPASRPPRGPGVTLRGAMLRAVARQTPPPPTPAPSEPERRTARPEAEDTREPDPLPPLRGADEAETSALPPLRA